MLKFAQTSTGNRLIMPIMQTDRDDKNNVVVTTLFESYLARFVLENPRFYKDIYCKVFDAISRYITELIKKFDENQAIKELPLDKKRSLDLSRKLFAIFSQVDSYCPDHSSFDMLTGHFTLQSADYFIKLVADELLPINDPLKNDFILTQQSPARFFSAASGSRSPYNPTRCPLLFAEKNRGVIPIAAEAEDELEEETRTIGIVAKEFVPRALENYFDKPVCCARFYYLPNEASLVARWLRERHLPVISGSSGSTEILFSRILPLVNLSPAETTMLVFAQACNMIANGHHSFFEAMLVAEHFGHTLVDKNTLLEFYLQCVPEVVRIDPQFIEYINSDDIKPLLHGMPLLDKSYSIPPVVFTSSPYP